MIVGEKKPLAEILDSLGSARRIIVVGCDTCVAECAAGGRKEVALMASALRIAFEKAGEKAEIMEFTLDRQCVYEFLPEVGEELVSADAVLSLACGAGVQAMARFYPDTVILPGLNTQFIGTTVEAGIWTEDCSGCGDCKLAFFGAVCPITRCAKKLLNGPCGGSSQGKCEVSPDVDCAWQLIYDRLAALHLLDRLMEFIPANNWSRSHSGGPRTIIREDRRT
ncbi:MAG: methylenetetrahydrofolate reductase C-terminal domain-containing protein [Deltaproteobacteria bacterium]|nr:methylenetetrahydrofolate reductase C-terminal domain-containing protein [Deltaproteobacteria bacterium]